MTFAEQLEFGLHTEFDPVSIEPYLAKEHPSGFKLILGYMKKIAESPILDCCTEHRIKTLMRIWCGGSSTTLKLYQMFGESDDLGDLLCEVDPYTV
jgi:hypothetical protein